MHRVVLGTTPGRGGKEPISVPKLGVHSMPSNRVRRWIQALVPQPPLVPESHDCVIWCTQEPILILFCSHNILKCYKQFIDAGREYGHVKHAKYTKSCDTCDSIQRLRPLFVCPSQRRTRYDSVTYALASSLGLSALPPSFLASF
jgi:hypothetical protein